MSSTILVIGVMVFLAHFLSLVFRKTNIPDVLILMSVGLLMGPVFGEISVEDFGKVGPVIASIALVVILFESGTSLRLEAMGRAMGTTIQLTLGCFLLTALVVGAVAHFHLGLAVFPAVLLGVILGGTSSAVVIPMVESMGLGEKAGTTLVLESALTDVLGIVGVFALLGVLATGEVSAGQLIGSIAASLVFATVLGILGGIVWLLILGRMRGFPNTISSTIAYAFIVYGATEFVGFSGAIAAMALGVTLTNFERMGLTHPRILGDGVKPLSDIDFAFYREAVFLLKTYFFVYLGISIRFSGTALVLVALGTIVVVYLLRALLVRRVFRQTEFSRRDAAIAASLAPKGLAAAVLASLPLQHGVPGGELIRDTAYMVVLVSILLSAVLVAIYKLSPVSQFYGWLLGKRE